MHQCQADDDANLIDLGIDELTRASNWELHDQFVNTYAPNKHPLNIIAERETDSRYHIKSNARHSNDEGSRGLYTSQCHDSITVVSQMLGMDSMDRR